MRSAVGDLVGRVDQTCRQTEVLQRIEHARCVPGPVVDDGDHPRRRVAKRLNVTPEGSDLFCDVHPPPLPSRCAPRRRRAGRRPGRVPPATTTSAATTTHAAGFGDGSVVLQRRPDRRLLPRPRSRRRCRTARRVRPSSSSRRCSSTRATATTSVATWRSPSRSSRPGGSPTRTVASCGRTTTTSPGSAHAALRQRLPVQQRARNGVRAQLQLLRNYADAASTTASIPDPPVPEAWGSNPSTAAYNFDHYFHKGRAPMWKDMGNGNWATAPDLRDAGAQGLRRDARVQRPVELNRTIRAITGPRRSAAPHRVPSCGTRPRPRRGRSSR